MNHLPGLRGPLALMLSAALAVSTTLSGCQTTGNQQASTNRPVQDSSTKPIESLLPAHGGPLLPSEQARLAAHSPKSSGKASATDQERPKDLGAGHQPDPALTQERPKPQHPGPLEEMDCDELQALLHDYRKRLAWAGGQPAARNNTGSVWIYHPAPPNGISTGAVVGAAIAGGLLGAMVAAGIQQERRMVYQETRPLYDEAYRAFEDIGCPAHFEKLEAQREESWGRAAKWRGSVSGGGLVDLGAGNSGASYGDLCSDPDVSVELGIDGELVLGEITLPPTGFEPNPQPRQVRLEGRYDSANNRLEAKTIDPDEDIHVFFGTPTKGEWKTESCNGTYALRPREGNKLAMHSHQGQTKTPYDGDYLARTPCGGDAEAVISNGKIAAKVTACYVSANGHCPNCKNCVPVSFKGPVQNGRFALSTLPNDSERNIQLAGTLDNVTLSTCKGSFSFAKH